MRLIFFRPVSSQNKQDCKLLTRLKKGDRVAVQEWYQQFFNKLLHFISLKVDKAADAEELAQDTFISCLKHLPIFRGDASIWTWMTSIANHEIADYYRRKYAKKAMQALPFDEGVLSESLVNAHETAQKVKEALWSLRVDYRELLLLKYVDKKQVTQIARELGRSVKSIESDLFRARNAFRQAYLQAE